MFFRVQFGEIRYNKVLQSGGQLPTMQLIIIFVLFSLLSMFFIEELSQQLIKINNPEVGADCVSWAIRLVFYRNAKWDLGV